MQKRKKNLYDFDYEEEKEEKLKKKKEKADRKSASKKKKRKKEEGQADLKKKYDDEIIIGVTKLPERKKGKSTSSPNKSINVHSNSTNLSNKRINKKTTKVKPKIQKSKVQQIKRDNLVNKRVVKRAVYNYDEDIYEAQLKKEKKRKKLIFALKIIAIIILFIGFICFCMLSPIFNVNTILVEGNSIVSKEQIISLSGIRINENIFKFSKWQISKNVMQNAYVDDVTVSKKLPDTITITIEERVPTYMIEFGNGYVYLNNQGYILEISSQKLELPIILGASTKEENIIAGNRLEQEDLLKLGTVIRIMDDAENNGIANLITTINIENEKNYVLYLESEKKTVYLGDCTNLETRMLYLVSILNNEKNIEGEIFINMNLNLGTEYPFFRESI